MKIKNILVSQPKPQSEKSPYFDLAESNKLNIDFKPFIQVQGVTTKEFRKQRINILDFTAVIFTSRTAIDHFFKMAEDTRVSISSAMKYFCTSESVALYLQKYITYRKRKIFHGERTIEDLAPMFLKHKSEKFLVPLSDTHKASIPAFLKKQKLDFKQVVLYRTVSSNLSDLQDVNYDILVFYSPSGIKSLKENFPEFEQNGTKIASFGEATAKAVKEAGLRVDIKAPAPNAPSMTMALEQYIKKFNKKK